MSSISSACPLLRIEHTISEIKYRGRQAALDQLWLCSFLHSQRRTSHPLHHVFLPRRQPHISSNRHLKAHGVEPIHILMDHTYTRLLTSINSRIFCTDTAGGDQSKLQSTHPRFLLISLPRNLRKARDSGELEDIVIKVELAWSFYWIDKKDPPYDLIF
ncbi:hypothetical protein ACET3Z_023160 [Daucus carota]